MKNNKIINKKVLLDEKIKKIQVFPEITAI